MKKEKIISSNVYFGLVVFLALVVIVESLLIINILKGEEITPPPVVKKFIPVLETKKGALEIVLAGKQKGQIVFNSPGEAIAGVDAILNFDPKLISLANISGNKDIFGQIIINTQQQKQGRIVITAYQPKKTLLGKQTLAFFTFRLLKNQPAEVKIEFRAPGVVTDSNLVSQKPQKDILGSVQSLKVAPE